MGLWSLITSQTSQSPLKLVAFGGVCIAASWGLGSLFTGLVAPATPVTPQDQRKRAENLSYDDRRFANAREQRLSNMIKDMLDGNVEQHWNAAMRGTLVKHPEQENKTEGLDRAALAKAAEVAEAAKSKRSWW